DDSWCKTKRFLSQHFEIYNPELVPDLLVEKYLEETDEMVCLVNMNRYSNNLVRGINIVRCEASQFQKILTITPPPSPPLRNEFIS
ncbi:12632_t:CDS:2, partial [Dentiscutata heterogama]